MGTRRELAERLYYIGSLGLGRLLRSASYSKVRVVNRNGEREVLKARSFYAPFVVSLGVPLVRALDTGVRVLAQKEWEERERRMYATLLQASVRVDNGVLSLPVLPGKTLASLLEDPGLAESSRVVAIQSAVNALSELHRTGVTHGDAMAENVMIDLDTGVASWFDFETVHEPGRLMTWRRADDVRAFLATCLVRTPPHQIASTVERVVHTYADEEITRLVAASFESPLKRPLAFHLGQAPLSLETFRQTGRLLSAIHASGET